MFIKNRPLIQDKTPIHHSFIIFNSKSVLLEIDLRAKNRKRKKKERKR